MGDVKCSVCSCERRWEGGEWRIGQREKKKKRTRGTGGSRNMNE
jgi:hypothetical protein